VLIPHPHTPRTPSDDVDSLCVPDEGRQVRNLPLLAIVLDTPKLSCLSALSSMQNIGCAIPERCCLRPLSPSVPCHEAQSGLSIWERSHCARTRAAEQPSSWCGLRLTSRSKWTWVCRGSWLELCAGSAGDGRGDRSIEAKLCVAWERFGEVSGVAGC
jgi:hypothetical protein